MTLSNRVSTFFLTALAVVLAGYSALIYVMAREHLYGEFDREMHGTLNTLVAAVEVEDDDAKFEPSDHLILASGGAEVDDVRWAVLDERGRLIDHSRNLVSAPAADPAVLAIMHTLSSTTDEPLEIEGWRVLSKRLAAPHPKDEDERAPQEHAALTVGVARSPATLHANLRWLVWLTTLLPLGVWLVAAAVGRSYTRRVLRPVHAMAERARSVTTADFSARLPAASGDELAELGSSFNRLLDRLQEAYERQQRFTGDAAHQLRTPLTVLLGQIEVALRRERSPEEYQQTLAMLREGTIELEQIVESLLFLARSDQEAASPDLETIDLNTWLDEYRDRWRDHARAGDLSFHADPGLTCRASPPLAAQLVTNLVDNALKYSSPGTPVSVRATAADPSHVSISVEDRGAGMTAEDRASIFKPFFRAPRARQAGVSGMGLGLAVAARIAQALGGELTCTSELDRGSRFTLTLPRAA